ncbi:MAG: hypothetical protein QY331_02380 [Melioribacteraceae bacterium]|nr:MAG: hypothetical protein QY331_02380 [Melioribacteraceae bacterium]
MKNEPNSHIKVKIRNLYFPIKVRSKDHYNGEKTIANISIDSAIELAYGGEFAKKIIQVISSRNESIGIYQLTKEIMDYCNSINAEKTSISYEYPYFINNMSFKSNNKIKKCFCQFSAEKDLLFEYKRKHQVTVPVTMYHALLSFLEDPLDSPIEIVVEFEGDDIIFTEDIVEIVEGSISKIIGCNSIGEFADKGMSTNNFKLRLLNNIRDTLISKHNISNCSVKAVNQQALYLFSVETIKSAEKMGLSGLKKIEQALN